MKKFLVLILFIFCVIFMFLFLSNKANSIEINGKKFVLKYSNCEKNSVVCMNEYYLENEYDTKWTELYTVVYGPQNDNPIAVASTLVNGQKYAQDLLVNKEENKAIAIFGIIYHTEQGKGAIEQNVAKSSFYKFGKGVLIQQYARRYIFEDNQYDKNVKNMKEFNNEYTLIVDKIPQTKMYMKPLQKW